MSAIENYLKKHAVDYREEDPGLDERKHPILHRMGQYAGKGGLIGAGIGGLAGLAGGPSKALLGAGLGGLYGASTGAGLGGIHGTFDLGRQQGRGVDPEGDSWLRAHPKTTGTLLHGPAGALAAYLGQRQGRSDVEKSAEDAAKKFGLDKVAVGAPGFLNTLMQAGRQGAGAGLARFQNMGGGAQGLMEGLRRGAQDFHAMGGTKALGKTLGAGGLAGAGLYGAGRAFGAGQQASQPDPRQQRWMR